MKRGRERNVASFVEFVFTATGADTDLQNLSAIDLYDNVIVECDRLHAIKELLLTAEDRLDSADLPGVALLLGDVEARVRTILNIYRFSAERPTRRTRSSAIRK